MTSPTGSGNSIVSAMQADESSLIFSARDVASALYQGLLGREGEPDGVAHWARLIETRGIDFVAGCMLGSGETMDRMGLKKIMQLAVIGNCVSQHLAAFLQTYPTVNIAACLNMSDMSAPQYAIGLKVIEARIPRIVISPPIGENFQDISNSKIRDALGIPLLTMMSVEFAGLHPDICYLDNSGNRILSPMNDYNSKIVVKAFLNGETELGCLARFNKATYLSLRYPEQYRISEDRLKALESSADIQFADAFLNQTRTTYTLFSSNHPTPAAIRGLAQTIGDALGLVGQPATTSELGVTLKSKGIWPIYPEISEVHALPYCTPMEFYTGREALNTESFIQGSYAAYRNLALGKLEAAAAKAGLLDLDL